jgi:hypothetical protein
VKTYRVVRSFAACAFAATLGAAACGDNRAVAIDAAPAADAAPDAAVDAAPDAGPDRLLDIYNDVDADHLTLLVKSLGGVVPVTVGNETFSINERYSNEGKIKFRKYWTQYMTDLGLQVQALPYPSPENPAGGVNLEAVLPGTSADSFVVIVHYDSIGPEGFETSNPGVDDDMTGMAIELETARLFVKHAAELNVTVRFVATDEEELGGLRGARAYASYIKQKSVTEGFALVAAVDDEQTGWNCRADGVCSNEANLKFDIFSCGSSMRTGASFNYAAMGDAFAAIVAKYSPLHVSRGCMGENSDHFAMWEIGVPTLVFSEHLPFQNDHFDQLGGDTFDKIDMAYLVAIARPAITFQATLAGAKR